MALTPYTIERFGGLNLADDPFEVGASGAIDLVNADFDRSGRVRARDGYTVVKQVTMSTPWGLAPFQTTAGIRQLVAGYSLSGTHKYQAYANTGGAAVATQTVTHSQMSAVRFGSPSAQYLYIANGADTVWRWDGAAFTQPAGMPTALYLALKPNSDRLVAGFTGGGNSRVEFSDAGAPETWSSNWVDLTPGDESTISGLASWQNYVFAFKHRRFFVFTGESTDADGLPIFNYDTVDGYGCIVPPAAGDEGVYFFDGRTVWLTTGSVPRPVSRAVEPFLRGLATINGDTLSGAAPANIRLSYALGRLYLTTLGGTQGQLVYDPKIDQWTYYTPLMYFATQLLSATGEAFVYWLGTNSINKYDPSVSTDDGSPISFIHKSGKYPLADPGRVAVAPFSSLVGTGTVTLRLDSDLYSGQSASATLGTAPTPAEGWPSGVDTEGTWVQYTLSGTGTASVSQIKHEVSFVKPVGVR